MLTTNTHGQGIVGVSEFVANCRLYHLHDLLTKLFVAWRFTRPAKIDMAYGVLINSPNNLLRTGRSVTSADASKTRRPPWVPRLKDIKEQRNRDIWQHLWDRVKSVKLHHGSASTLPLTAGWSSLNTKSSQCFRCPKVKI